MHATRLLYSQKKWKETHFRGQFQPLLGLKRRCSTICNFLANCQNLRTKILFGRSMLLHHLMTLSGEVVRGAHSIAAAVCLGSTVYV